MNIPPLAGSGARTKGHTGNVFPVRSEDGKSKLVSIDDMSEDDRRFMSQYYVDFVARCKESIREATEQLGITNDPEEQSKLNAKITDYKSWVEFYEDLIEKLKPKEEDASKDKSLPEEIRKLEKQDIIMYKEALKGEEVRVDNVKIMVVGHPGVGKTTLAKRLMNEEVDIDKKASTDGIDVHVHRLRMNLEDGSWEKETDDGKQKVYRSMAKAFDSHKRKSEEGLHKLMSTSSSASTDDEAKQPATSGTPTIPIPTSHSKFFLGANVRAEKGEMEWSANPSTSFNEAEISEEVFNEATKVHQHAQQISQIPEYAELSIYDFAGQYVYYSSHQVFLKADAVYILVIDISKTLEQELGDDRHCDIGGGESCRVGDYFDYWLNIIHLYTGEREDSSTPVILVATFADTLDEFPKEVRKEKIKEFFLKIRRYLSDKPTKFHLVKEEFAINNKIVDPCLGELKRKVFELAKCMRSWGKLVPARWLRLQKELLETETKGQKVISYDDVKILNSKMEVPLPEEQINLFLTYMHDSGKLMYFNDPGLRDTVVLDPKWLVDAFKSLITASDENMHDPKIIDRWMQFEKDGLLRPELLDLLWKKSGNESFSDNKSYLLRLFEQLNIAAQPTVANEKRFHLMPCKLKDGVPEDVIPSKDETCSPVLVYQFRSKFLPTAVFHRLVAACLTKWQLDHRGNCFLIYKDCCVFDIDNTLSLFLVLCGYVIQVIVANWPGETTDLDLTECARARIFVQENLDRILGCMNYTAPYDVCIKCPKVGLHELTGFIEVKNLERKRTWVCRSHERDIHNLSTKELLNWWYRDEEHAMHSRQIAQPSKKDLKVRPTYAELWWVSDHIGKEYQMLGVQLGLPQAKIDRIVIENKFSVRDQIYHILKEWLRTSKTTTFQALKEAMNVAGINTTFLESGR